MTKAPASIFPIAPGTMTVAIDPGHGGGDPGAIRPPLAEKTANLDIALRLRAMLLGAGVKVVMTRTSDSKVNRKNVDWTRDGKVGYRDELASRIEIANAARADVFVVVHNNGTPPGVGGTETWYDPTRPFACAQQDARDVRPAGPDQVAQDAVDVDLEADQPGHPPGAVLRAPQVQAPLQRAPERDAGHPRRVAGHGQQPRAPAPPPVEGQAGHRRGLLPGPEPLLRGPHMGRPSTTSSRGPGPWRSRGPRSPPGSG